jgi:hypothetical protein
MLCAFSEFQHEIQCYDNERFAMITTHDQEVDRFEPTIETLEAVGVVLALGLEFPTEEWNMQIVAAAEA